MSQTSAPMHPPGPTNYSNSDGLGLRLQCFLAIRDSQRRVACVQLKGTIGWSLPGETLQPNESPDAAAARVAKVWFDATLPAKLVAVQSYPDDGDHKWYLLFIYEATAPKEGLKALEDTEKVAFAAPGAPPGPFGMDHQTVFSRLPK